MDNIEKLAEYFKKFPGIGPKQARRFVYHILSRDKTYIKSFIEQLTRTREDATVCSSCLRIYIPKFKNQTSLCEICGDNNRDKAIRMIVSKEADLEAIEKSKSYNGLYFVIGGNINMLESDFHSNPRILALEKLAEKAKNSFKENSDVGKVNEFILSFSINPEGQHTLEIIKSILQPYSKDALTEIFKITHPARGLSSGSELEYSDSETIREALKNRY